MITLGGINTGLPPNLVEQLIEAEKIPMRNVEARKGRTEKKLGLVNDFETRLREVQTSLKSLAGTRGFSDIKLESGDPNIVTGVVDPELVQKGNFNIEVIRLANKAAAISNGFPDKDETEVGIGYFRFETPDGDKEVFLDGENNTLTGAADAINKANVGVKARVINDRTDSDRPFKLMITGEGVGDGNEVEYPTLYFLDGDQDFYFDQEKPAQNGLIKIDGFEMEVPSNTVEDLIPGVTLQLRQQAPGRTVNLTVAEDQEVVSGKIKEFVDGMNKVFGFIQQQNNLNQNSDTRSTLGGDSLLRTVESRLRSLILSPQMGDGNSIRRISDVGITFNRGGLLDFNEEKFNSTLAKHVDDVQAFFVGNGFSTGFIAATRNVINGAVDGAFGPVTNRKRGLQSQIASADRRIEGMERRLAQREKTLRRQFANLEETMSKIKSQGSYLAQRLGSGGGLNLNLGGASQSG